LKTHFGDQYKCIIVDQLLCSCDFASTDQGINSNLLYSCVYILVYSLWSTV